MKIIKGNYSHEHLEHLAGEQGITIEEDLIDDLIEVQEKLESIQRWHKPEFKDLKLEKALINIQEFLGKISL